MYDPDSIWRGIRVEDMCKHICVLAMPGSFKSTLIRHLMILLFKLSIPAIVFEPGKRESRTMKAMVCPDDPDVARFCQAIRVYTPGDENISPLRMDSLDMCLGIPTSQKIANMVSDICASGDYFDPLPQIIYEALSQDYFCYQYCNGPKPNIACIYKRCIELLSIRYGPEVRDNLIGALESRLSKWGNGYSATGRVFRCGQNIPSIESLVIGHNIIELAALGDSDFPFVTLQLLQAVKDYLGSTPWPDKSKPRLVLILEESHRFFPNLSEGNMSEKVATFITNMLQEMRSLGVAIILVDQTPSALPVSVLKATATKLVGRQVYGPDRQTMTDCMMLNEHQRDDLAHLSPGEFYLFAESFPRAVKIRVPNIYQKISIPFADELLGEKILEHISNDHWFLDCRHQRITAELKLLATEIEGFSKTAVNLISTVLGLLSIVGESNRQSLAARSAKLYKQIENVLQQFHKNHLIPLAGLDNNTVYVEPHKSFRDHLLCRFETLETRLSGCRKILEKHN